MTASPGASVTRTALIVLTAGALAVPVLVLRALPAADVGAVGLGWLPVMLAAGLLVAGGGATVAALIAGIRHGSLAALLIAGMSASLVGAALLAVNGVNALALPVTAAGGFGLAASIADRGERLVAGTRARVLVASGLVVAAETAVVVQLLMTAVGLPSGVEASIMAAGAVAAVLGTLIAVTRAVGPAIGMLAVGTIVLAVARDSSADQLLGLVGLIAAALLAARGSLEDAPGDVGADEGHLPPLATHLSTGILIFDGSLHLRAWNPAAGSLLGLAPDSAGSRIEDLLGISLAQLPAAAETVMRRTPIGGIEMTLVRDGGSLAVILHDPSVTSDTERLGRELRGTIEELLQTRRTLELQRAELERASSTDRLTGVASRQAILQRLRLEVSEARRYQHPFAAVLLDIDLFTIINASHGIDGGDAVLREVALRARVRVREADAIGRSGSDAFLALLPHTDVAGAMTFAEALRRRIGRRPISVADGSVSVTLSIGVSVMHPGDDVDADGLLARLDEALADAVRAGGDQVALDPLHALTRLTDARMADGDEESRATGD